jgi:DNA-directed RNA polymerase subunit RPC12/RpoP
MYDYALSAVGVLPWRCSTCQIRFHARRVPPSVFLRAHCPRCGNPHLQRISSDRVDEGPFLPFKRIMKLPAYRCDPCRMKFHSVRPRYRGAHPGA